MPNIDTHSNMYKRFLTSAGTDGRRRGYRPRGVCVCVCRTLDLTGGSGGERQRGASERQPPPLITRCALHNNNNNNNNNIPGADLSGTHIYIVYTYTIAEAV